jgi:hypothetical protein
MDFNAHPKEGVGSAVHKCSYQSSRWSFGRSQHSTRAPSHPPFFHPIKFQVIQSWSLTADRRIPSLFLRFCIRLPRTMVTQSSLSL